MKRLLIVLLLVACVGVTAKSENINLDKSTLDLTHKETTSDHNTKKDKKAKKAELKHQRLLERIEKKKSRMAIAENKRMWRDQQAILKFQKHSEIKRSRTLY